MNEGQKWSKPANNIPLLSLPENNSDSSSSSRKSDWNPLHLHLQLISWFRLYEEQFFKSL